MKKSVILAVIAMICVGIFPAKADAVPKKLDEALYCAEYLYAVADLPQSESGMDAGTARLMNLFGDRWLQEAYWRGTTYGLRKKETKAMRKPYAAEAKEDAHSKHPRFSTCGKMVGM